MPKSAGNKLCLRLEVKIDCMALAAWSRWVWSCLVVSLAIVGGFELLAAISFLILGSLGREAHVFEIRAAAVMPLSGEEKGGKEKLKKESIS